MPYLRGASEIELHDPYIRMNHQGRNLVELLALIAAAKDPADEVTFKLFTLLETDPEYQKRQLQMIGQIIQGGLPNRASSLTWLRTLAVMIAGSARTTDGASTSAGGLDIFQKQEGGWFDFGSTRQEFRQARAFGVTYIREAN